MLIPSITLRLDFGEGSLSDGSGGISLQGEVPTPMGFGSGLAGVTQVGLPTPLASIAGATAQDTAPTPMGFGSGLAGVTQVGLPTPLASIAEAAAQGTAPTPMAGIRGMSAAMEAPPVPSPDIMSSARASGMTDDMPRPEGEPEVVKKELAGKN